MTSKIKNCQGNCMECHEFPECNVFWKNEDFMAGLLSDIDQENKISLGIINIDEN